MGPLTCPALIFSSKHMNRLKILGTKEPRRRGGVVEIKSETQTLHSHYIVPSSVKGSLTNNIKLDGEKSKPGMSMPGL